MHLCLFFQESFQRTHQDSFRGSINENQLSIF